MFSQFALLINKTTLRLLASIFLVFVTLWLRLVNLGYSDYQGDEVQALYSSSPGQTLWAYLLQQRRGPTQYLITSFIKLVDPTYGDEFMTRLPFALAGILSVYFFYQFLKLSYGNRIALYASLFLSLNGLFIGLSRIVQYQPFVLLFTSLTLYTFSLAVYIDSWRVKGIYIGTLCWSAAILTHFDSIFLAPYVIYQWCHWYTGLKSVTGGDKWKHLALSITVGALPLLVFYIPSIFSTSGETVSYWSSRLAGQGENINPSSSIFTFTLYNPTIVIYLYGFLLLFSTIKFSKDWSIWLWFLFPWVVYEFVVFDPGTHIYTYIMPATILLAFGVITVKEILDRLFRNNLSHVVHAIIIGVMFLFLFSLAHLIFIDHTPEYPWEQRKFLFWKLGRPESEYQLWVFGFPYYRKWEQIGAYVNFDDNVDFCFTNENWSIATFYLDCHEDLDRAGYFIHIENPQSLKNVQRTKGKLRYWIKNYEPVQILLKDGRQTAEIYLMPEGDISEIREAGY